MALAGGSRTRAAPAIGSLLGQAAGPVSSELTLAECRRALRRLSACGQQTQQEAQDRAWRLERLMPLWSFSPVSTEILNGVQTAFPVEPLRTLDAIHLCTALRLRPDLPGLGLLSLDRRVRDNGTALGFPVLP